MNYLYMFPSHDRSGNLQLGFFTSSISPNYRRYDLPAGPQNLVNGGFLNILILFFSNWLVILMLACFRECMEVDVGKKF